MKLELNKIITGDLNKKMSKKKMAELKEEAKKIVTYTSNKTYNYDYSQSEDVFEKVYTKSKYQKYTNDEKAVIIEEAIFPDSKKFLDVLYNSAESERYNNSNNGKILPLNYQSLKNLLTYLVYIKAAKVKQVKLDNKVLEQIKKYCKHYFIVLHNVFARQMGKVQIEAVINKLNEIFSFENDLFLEFEKANQPENDDKE